MSRSVGMQLRIGWDSSSDANFGQHSIPNLERVTAATTGLVFKPKCRRRSFMPSGHSNLRRSFVIVRDLGLTTNTVTVLYDHTDQLMSWSAKEKCGNQQHG